MLIFLHFIKHTHISLLSESFFTDSTSLIILANSSVEKHTFYATSGLHLTVISDLINTTDYFLQSLLKILIPLLSETSVQSLDTLTLQAFPINS